MRPNELNMPLLHCPACGSSLDVRYRRNESGSREAVCECPVEECKYAETHIVADALLAAAAACRRRQRAA